jgi:rubrerythrin
MDKNYQLDLGAAIFSDNFTKLTEKLLPSSKFSKDYISDWVYAMYIGEYDTTIVYPQMLKNFVTNSYQNQIGILNDIDIQDITRYFDKMIKDENDHTALLETVLEKTFSRTPNQNDFKICDADMSYRLSNFDLSHMLTYYYVGECCIWTGFYLLYKNNNNPVLNKIFHKLIVDESHHNNNFYKIFKKIKTRLRFNKKYYIHRVRCLRYLHLGYLQNMFQFEDNNTKKSSWWIKTIFGHNWQQQYNTIFIKKCYKVYEIYHPNCTFEEFTNIINFNFETT